MRCSERHQAVVVAVAAAGGLLVGAGLPAVGSALGPAVWPALGMLLLATFAQVPPDRLRAAAADRRFLATVLAGNAVVLPLVAGLLLALAPDDPAARLGVLLVLLAPCTDWFVTFAHLGGGDARRALAVTPLNLALQIVVVPLWLWILLGGDGLSMVPPDRAVGAFAGVVLLPLAVVVLARRRAPASSDGGPATTARLLERAARLTVPLLGLVVLLVAAASVETVVERAEALARLALVYVAFLALAGALGVVAGRLARLGPAATRTVVFGYGTRNSFVVLPVALALPEGAGLAVVAVVLQSLVELAGMAAYLLIVPRLVPDRARPAG